MRRFSNRQINTLIVLHCVAIMLWLFCGCKSSRSAIDESHNLTFVDTTKVETHSTGKSHNETDTTKTATKTEQSAVIEFVDGGGTVSIDSAGNLTLSGVKSMQGSFGQSVVEQKGISRNDKTVSTHDSRHGGIGLIEDSSRHEEKESKAEAPKWYQSLLAKIGGLCCIAALIYAIFLYLKRKM